MTELNRRIREETSIGVPSPDRAKKSFADIQGYLRRHSGKDIAAYLIADLGLDEAWYEQREGLDSTTHLFFGAKEPTAKPLLFDQSQAVLAITHRREESGTYIPASLTVAGNSKSAGDRLLEVSYELGTGRLKRALFSANDTEAHVNGTNRVTALDKNSLSGLYFTPRMIAKTAGNTQEPHQLIVIIEHAHAIVRELSASKNAKELEEERERIFNELANKGIALTSFLHYVEVAFGRNPHFPSHIDIRTTMAKS